MFNVQYIDTHAHLYEEDYAQDIDQVIARAREAGAVKILIPPTDVDSTLKAMELCSRYPDFLYPMIGLHPEDVRDDYHSALQQLEQILIREIEGRLIAIGEVGLDYYWDKTHKEEQKDAFRIQIDWAAKYQLPLMIHSRNAGNDLLECLRPYKDQLTRGGVFHCFSGSAEMAKELLRRGWYLGFDGPVTYKNARKAIEVLEIVPPERILVETDSPYMSPVPLRGKRNDSSNLVYIIQKIAEIKGMTPQEIERITWENGKRLFGIA